MLSNEEFEKLIKEVDDICDELEQQEEKRRVERLNKYVATRF